MSANYFQEDEILGKAYDARLTRRLLTYLRPHRLVVVAGVVLLLLGALADLAGPYIVKTAIDNDMCPALHLRTGVCRAVAVHGTVSFSRSSMSMALAARRQWKYSGGVSAWASPARSWACAW